MRVLQVTPRYVPAQGGIEIHVREVASRLAARGHAVTVLTTDVSRTMSDDEEVDGVRVLRVPAWPRGLDFYLAPDVARIVARGGWDVIHVQGVHTLVPPVAMGAGLRRGIPYVISLHTGGHRSRLRHQLRDVQWLALRPLLARAKRIIGVSRFEARHFERLLHLPPAKFTIVPNGAGLSGLSAGPKIVTRSAVSGNGSEGPLVVSVGRLERYKGHHRVIEALPHLLPSWPHARVLVLGEGPYLAQLERIAARAGVADRVEFAYIPPIDRERMAAVLSRADVVCLLSEYEAHPLAVLEALAVGCPVVVVTDQSGLHDLVEDGLATGVPQRSSPPAVAAALDMAMRRPPAGPPTLPTWDACTDRLVEIYREATAG